MLTVIKAHAYGNDFLLVEEGALPPEVDRPALALALCERHRGLGADGLIFFRAESPGVASMALLNADGSYSEVSGNGVRCLAAWIADQIGGEAGVDIEIRTDAGTKRLRLLERTTNRWRFRAAMGRPEALATASLDLDGEAVEVVTLRVGNPQCVVLGPVTHARLHGVAARLAVHPHFPQGTNVELAAVESPTRVHILIWERGVGPTEASGTGACAAAVAAMAYGGAHRDVEVTSPGGTQRVEWLDDGLYLTGAAEIIATCRWRDPPPLHTASS